MFENKVDNCKVEISDDNKCVLYDDLIFIITYQIGDDYHCRGINFIDNDKFSAKFTKYRRIIGPGVYIMDGLKFLLINNIIKNKFYVKKNN